MRDMMSRAELVAKARKTTLITGPTGVGKDVLASWLHRRGQSPDAPFVTVNCGALPESLIESELFGHLRGAFTGAQDTRKGLIKNAAGGTLFLDEINSLCLNAQSKLLRFLETGEYRRVGSDHLEYANVWVLAASNRNLQNEVQRGSFREDLLFRLAVMHLDIPPLRMRDGDIELLARHFLTRVSNDLGTFTPRAVRAIYKYAWPGNVRELKARVERAAYLSRSSTIDMADLELDGLESSKELIMEKKPLKKTSSIALSDLYQLIEKEGLTLGDAIARCEKAIIQAALDVEHGNRTQAARRLGIHVRTMFKKLANE